jgi:hypothetical protein
LSRRRFGGVLALLGVIAAVAFLVIPVDAAFAANPLLRYGRFTTPEPAVTDVDCGAPVSNLLRRADGVSFYSLARADACRDAASRRAATAVAGGALLAVLGLSAVAGATRRGDG